jgi:hypothetical protein
MKLNLKSIIILLPLIAFSFNQDCCEAADIAEDNCGGLGCYIPECTEDCEWVPMQCWSSTGYCWCVDQDGNEIEGTSTPAWQGQPDCEEFEECVDGEVNNENPCNPMECWDGTWVEIVIDCAEGFGIPCEGGLYIPPPEDQCCSDCISFGDINYDGSIDVLDAIEVVNLILNGEHNDIVDMNFDGTVNVLDIIEIIYTIIN